MPLIWNECLKVTTSRRERCHVRPPFADAWGAGVGLALQATMRSFDRTSYRFLAARSRGRNASKRSLFHRWTRHDARQRLIRRHPSATER